MSHLSIENPQPLRNLLLGVWLCAIVVLLYIIVPNTDDKSYGFPAMNFVANGHMALSLGKGGYQYVFYNMPGTSFLESGMYWVMVKLLHIPLNFYTYRIPMALLYVGILLLTMRFITTTVSYATARQIVFLTLIGISLFAETWILNRPETPAAFFLLLHLVLFNRWLRKPRQLTALAAGLSLGAIPMFHPQFVSLGLMILAVDGYRLFKAKQTKGLILFLLGGLLPALLVLHHYWVHMPISWTVLHNQLNQAHQAHPFNKLFADTFSHHSSKLILLINFIFYVPALMMFGYCCLRIAYKTFKKSLTTTDLYAVAIFIGSIIVFGMSWGEPYTAGVCMMLILLTFVLMLDDKTCSWVSRFFTQHKFITALVCCVVAAFYAEMHITKFTLFPGRYLFPQQMIAWTHQQMQRYDAKVVATGAVYKPLFINNFYKQAEHPDAQKNFYWILPSDGQMVELPRDRVQARAYLSDLLGKPTNLIIMTVPKYLHINKIAHTARLTPMDSKLSFIMKFKKVLYHKGQHLIVLANTLQLHEDRYAQ